MKFKKKTAVAWGIAFLGLLIALPATRDELNWCWAGSRDKAADYTQYLTDWPHGRHALDAKLRFQLRTRDETKRAMIEEAIRENSQGQSDPEAHRERLARVERFYWTKVTNENTVGSYRAYLHRYPGGEFTGPAYRHIEDLYRRAANLVVSTNSQGR